MNFTHFQFGERWRLQSIKPNVIFIIQELLTTTNINIKMFTCQKAGGNGGVLARVTPQELFVGVLYPAEKGLDWSCWFPYCLHCLNTGDKEELWGRVLNLPTELTEYEKLSPRDLCEQVVVIQANLFSRTGPGQEWISVLCNEWPLFLE